jgi:tetratricopeptide (TPR) repeat protein
MKSLLRFYLSLAARLCVRFKQFDRALELYDEIEKMTPGNAAPVMAQGHVWGLKGDRARAKAEFERARRMNPAEAIAHFNVGWVCDQQGLHDEAIKHFNRALELNPDIDRAWYGIGIIHIKHERHEEAKQAFKEVVRIEPMSMHGWYQLGMTHFVLGETGELEGLKRHTCVFNPKIAHLLDIDIKKLQLQRAAASTSAANVSSAEGAAPGASAAAV